MKIKDLFSSWAYGVSPISLLLYPVGLFYCSFVELRRFLYIWGFLESSDLPPFVIGVGNLTVGGTGKTPFVIGLSRALKEKGYNVCVISRGYKRKGEGCVLVSDGESIFLTSEESGDEPYIIAKKTGCPVAVGRKRAEAYKLLEKFAPDVIILDDAFQHLAVKKDIDFCLIDGIRGFGNGFCLPAGPLRERISSLRRADALVITKSRKVGVLSHVEGVLSSKPVFFYLPKIKKFLCKDKEIFPPFEAALVTCVVNHEYLVEELVRRGVDIKRVYKFTDHHRYSYEDLRSILVKEKRIVVTEKDWVNMEGVLETSDSVVVCTQDESIGEDILTFVEEKIVRQREEIKES